MFEGRFGAIPSGDAGHARPGVGALAAEVEAVDRRGEFVGSLDDTAGPELVGLQQAVRVVAGVCAEGAAEVALENTTRLVTESANPGANSSKMRTQVSAYCSFQLRFSSASSPVGKYGVKMVALCLPSGANDESTMLGTYR